MLTLPTSVGNLSIPQLGGTLTLNGRDSKIHVVDYDINGTTVLYSTAEIFTWKVFGQRKVLLVYGGGGEHHEISILSNSLPVLAEGPDAGVTMQANPHTTIAWDTSSDRRVVKVDNLDIYILGE